MDRRRKFFVELDSLGIKLATVGKREKRSWHRSCSTSLSDSVFRKASDRKRGLRQARAIWVDAH